MGAFESKSRLGYRVTLFAGLVEAAVIGLCVGYSMGSDASRSPVLAALVVAAGGSVSLDVPGA